MTLQEIVDCSRRIVFFGGAGVSTESGIPDFRSVDGLYHQQYDYPPEQILSRSFFDENPAEFYRLPQQNAVSACQAQRCPLQIGRAGASRQVHRCGDPEY